MLELKVINSVIQELEEERGIPREKAIDAIEQAFATAYRKEYGKRGQIVRAKFDPATGKTEFLQVKIVVEPAQVLLDDEERAGDEDDRVRFNPEHHILIEDARKMKKDVQLDDELVFPLEPQEDFGRIAAQTAKQVIIQKIREAEKTSILKEYGEREEEIVSGTVQRIERGTVYLDLGRAPAILPYDEQIPGERFRQGERIRAYLYSVEEGTRGIFLRVSRSHPRFLIKLFEQEVPELASGTVEVKMIAREPGSRSKIAVASIDEHIDPVGSLVGQRGVRVSTVMSELGGEKIDVIEWSEDPKEFIEEALSPAKVLSVTVNEETRHAVVEVTEDQQSLAIGRSGQNVRLAAKLTGWKIDIRSTQGETIAEVDMPDTSIVEPQSEETKDEEPKQTDTADTPLDETKEESDTVEKDAEENDTKTEAKTETETKEKTEKPKRKTDEPEDAEEVSAKTAEEVKGETEK